uniref:STI1 domain-containing protein n=2 Tax=Guillardia theta TaxID=55529 RepID=A0A7S4PHY7_GUITH
MFNARDPTGSRRWTPEMAKAQVDMMQNPSMMQQAQQLMSTLPPEQLQSLMQSSMAASAAFQQPQASSTPAIDRRQLEEMTEKMRQNPQMMRQAAETMKNMDPEVMANMLAAQSQTMGMKITPEMAKMSAEMMSKITPEDMDRLMENAGKMSPGIPNVQAERRAPGQMPEVTPEMQKQMSEMMKDPEVRKSMTNMMKSMDPEMMRQMGLNADKEQLEKAAAVMENLSPDQMERMMSFAMRIQQAYYFYKRNAWVRYLLLFLLLAFLWWMFGGWVSGFLSLAQGSPSSSSAQQAKAATAQDASQPKAPDWSGKASAVVEDASEDEL